MPAGERSHALALRREEGQRRIRVVQVRGDPAAVGQEGAVPFAARAGAAHRSRFMPQPAPAIEEPAVLRRPDFEGIRRQAARQPVVLAVQRGEHLVREIRLELLEHEDLAERHARAAAGQRDHALPERSAGEHLLHQVHPLGFHRRLHQGGSRVGARRRMSGCLPGAVGGVAFRSGRPIVLIRRRRAAQPRQQEHGRARRSSEAAQGSGDCHEKTTARRGGILRRIPAGRGSGSGSRPVPSQRKSRRHRPAPGE